jgi:hypothetical protein
MANWFMRLFGLGKVDKLNDDINALNKQVASGDYQAMMAASNQIQQNAQQGGYGGPGVHVYQGVNPYADPRMQQAMAQSAMVGAVQNQQQNAQRAVATNPQLVAPQEGVTIEQYAAISAQQGSLPNPQALDQLLAQHGMDRAKWDRVANAWQARMRDDTTFTLMTIYGQAFGGAGAGQYGAAGAAGAQAIGATGAAGMAQGPAGGPPCTWEKYNEIGGAQRAWSASGKDVNAMLRQQFGISAVDWSNASQYWMAKMMSEPQKMMEMDSLQQRWAAHYAAPRADGDLKF